ncbi:uncharacterized protein LOC660945 [Tribolium castaneum]|uniref:Uncharacterized protein n=1 Tax=Tribolium castaneum TaxID=7070 RepID=D6WUI7_TRICA|nr:PREDICTED: uncharacterized protein LOC660945 [Tribolium castaneum]EFA08380.1 hypothetical protein TcasGA2_TC006023 [Tribolium castaneum]|eukprot:XP_972232.1 PREDICTED: uncharacterized protein LOC660945 [Tribolium castaneum]
MAEGTYEYECMRAELLGIEKPDYDEFLKRKQAEVEAEEQEIENLKSAESEAEQVTHIAGGLEELSGILQVTQRKLTRFKASCGSLTNLLKIKIGASSEANDVVPPLEAHSVETGERSELDKLDSLIQKAEDAQYSMAHQNKQMKRFLN